MRIIYPAPQTGCIKKLSIKVESQMRQARSLLAFSMGLKFIQRKGIEAGAFEQRQTIRCTYRP